MPSPSSPLEYRPTPHLIIVILFIVFPLIYLCARLVVTGCFVVAFILKSMFSRFLQFLYKDELIPVSRFPRRRPLMPLQNSVSTVHEVPVETSSDEQLTDESDEEHELMTTKITDDMIKAEPEASIGFETGRPSPLVIQTESLHDSERDSGNDEDRSAMSATSTATTATSQSSDMAEARIMPNYDDDAFEKEQLRHRENAVQVNGTEQ